MLAGMPALAALILARGEIWRRLAFGGARPGDPIEIYFSADAEFVPLYIEAGWKSMRLVKRASDGRRCDG